MFADGEAVLNFERVDTGIETAQTEVCLEALKHAHAEIPSNVRYLDTLQRSEDEYAALKDQIKAAKAATKKVLSNFVDRI